MDGLSRPIASSTLMREECDGVAIEMNKRLRRRDRDWRIHNYYLPYHLVLGHVANLVSVSHSRCWRAVV